MLDNKKIFEVLNITDDKYVNSIEFTKIKHKTKDKILLVYITSKIRLDLDFFHKLKEGFKSLFLVNEVEIFLEVDEYKDDYFKDYYEELIEDYKDLSIYRYLSSIYKKDGVYKIDVINDAEKEKIQDVVDNISEDLKKLGYLYDIDVYINEEKNKLLDMELEKEKQASLNSVSFSDNKPSYTPTSPIVRTNLREMKNDYEITPLNNLVVDPSKDNIYCVRGIIFEVEFRETKKENDIYIVKINDGTNSLVIKTFVKKTDSEMQSFLGKLLKVGNNICVRGVLSHDQYDNGELSLMFREIKQIERVKEEIKEKRKSRVELHAHSKLSVLDSSIDPKDLVKHAYKLGHRGVAITDHDGVLAFPEVFKEVKSINKTLSEEEKFKALYGTELVLVDDFVEIVINPKRNVLDQEYVVFDTETTGLEAKDKNQMIEIGAVKIKNGKVIDRFDELIACPYPLDEKIISLTNITNEMLKDKRSEEEVVKSFLEFTSSSILVAHNARFDMSFLNYAIEKYNLPTIKNDILDTLILSRYLTPNEKYHNLSTITKRYQIDFSEEGHHRADYDAEATALVLLKMFEKLDVKTIEELKKIKIIDKTIVFNNHIEMLNDTFVVFDTETTGLNAVNDKLIEIGAVKIKNGVIIDRFDELINPGISIPEKITEITTITNEMVKDKRSEKEVVKDFIEWIEDYPMVAHNAHFDVSFIRNSLANNNYGNLNNPVIDTLVLSRFLDNEEKRHSLSAITKRYEIEFSEEGHHRADYDAEATALVFHKMLQKIAPRDILTLDDLPNIINKDDIHKFGRTYHINLIAQNREGLKNLFKIVSYANTKYFYKGEARILRSVLEKLRENILISSGCYQSEIFVESRYVSENELDTMIDFYDFVEVQPPVCYSQLIDLGDFTSIEEIKSKIKYIIERVKSRGKIIVATGDVHTLNKEDEIYRKILINQKVPGGGRHPLNRNNIKNIPNTYFRTTEEMLEEFNFLDESLREEIVVDNTLKILDLCENIEVIIDTKGIPFSPKIKDSDKETRRIVYEKAHELYGEELPEYVENRIEEELKGIIGGGFDVIYLIAQKLVKKSNDDGYIVGSRGSVGSSFVATMMGITEVNPLKAHYLCPNCKHSIFEIDGKSISETYSSGYDLPEKKCPKCDSLMKGEGQDMPFATFLGFNADKVPDIDLNFSGDYQSHAHDYTKVLFGEDKVFRAGTVGTAAEKTAFGYVKAYLEEKGITNFRKAEIERIAKKLVGVKRTTGQHPGGIVVVPDYMDIFDFTPYQYPANEKGEWYTTHFDYHAIDECLLKLDILGHDDPTMIKMLEDLSGIDIKNINVGDEKILSLFSGTEVMNVTPEQIGCKIGTLGLPELGTDFVINMLLETKPKTFSELVKISGLSHGTDVWNNNAQDLVKSGIEFKNIIGCRDDIMVNLISYGIEPLKSFKIMEFVRKGKPSKEKDQWLEYAAIMKEHNVPEWYIESCHKIKYMFPKAHACAYVLSALRIAYFKVYYPIYYYAAYFSIREHDFDVYAMVNGYDKINETILMLEEKGYGRSNKEDSVLGCLRVVREASSRGIKFLTPRVNESEAKKFKVIDDKTLLLPFIAMDGLGEIVAENIVKERNIKEYTNIEEFEKRGKISSTLIKEMRLLNMFDGMDESSQLSLF